MNSQAAQAAPAMARNLAARAVMILPNAGSVLLVRSAVGDEPSSSMISRMAMMAVLWAVGRPRQPRLSATAEASKATPSSIWGSARLP